MIAAGTLNKRVVIERRATGADSIGQPLTGWVTHDTVWASIKYPSGLAAMRADAEISKVKASIRIRQRSDVSGANRIRHGSTIYQIMAVLPGEGVIDLVCEVVA